MRKHHDVVFRHSGARCQGAVYARDAGVESLARSTRTLPFNAIPPSSTRCSAEAVLIANIGTRGCLRIVRGLFFLVIVVVGIFLSLAPTLAAGVLALVVLVTASSRPFRLSLWVRRKQGLIVRELLQLLLRLAVHGCSTLSRGILRLVASLVHDRSLDALDLLAAPSDLPASSRLVEALVPLLIKTKSVYSGGEVGDKNLQARLDPTRPSSRTARNWGQ